MAVYYPSLTISASSPGSMDLYAGNGMSLFVAKTGTTASNAVTYLNSATTSKWVIPLNPGSNTFWFSSTSVVPYIAYYIVRPEGYSGPTTKQLSTATTQTITVGGSWSYKYPTSSFLVDLWGDRQDTTTNWLADITSFESYENMQLCPASSVTNYYMYYGTGNTAWTAAQMGKRYASCANLGFKSNWSTGFATYYTSKPATYTGYTVNVSTTTVTLNIYDGVTGYGSHSIQHITLYAVSTGGTRTQLLTKLGASTIAPGTTTSVSLGRSTAATIQGVKRLELDFEVNVGNGISVIEFECSSYYGQVDYEMGSLTTVATSDLEANLTISNGIMFDMQLN